jgi:MFS family permease
MARFGGRSVEAEGGRRALFLLSVSVMLAMSTWFSATVVIPQLTEAWDLTDSGKSLLTIMVQLGFVAGALATSITSLPDLVPSRVLIAIGSCTAAGANILLLAANGLALGLGCRFLTGAALALVYPPAIRLMSTWFVKRRGAALGIIVGALTIGSALPHLVNAVVDLDWQTVIVATSALTVAGGAIGSIVHEGPFGFERAVFAPRRAIAMLRNRELMLTTLGYFGHMWELYAMWAWIAVFMRFQVAERGGSATTAALIAFAIIAVGAPGCYVAGRLADRVGRARTTIVMMSVSGACAAGIGLLVGQPTWLVAAVGLLWGVAVISDSAQFSALVTEFAERRYVGTALALQLALGFTLTVVTIWLVPLMVEAVGWRWAFLVLVPGPLIGIAAMARVDGVEKPAARRAAEVAA